MKQNGVIKFKSDRTESCFVLTWLTYCDSDCLYQSQGKRYDVRILGQCNDASCIRCMTQVGNCKEARGNAALAQMSRFYVDMKLFFSPSRISGVLGSQLHQNLGC